MQAQNRTFLYHIDTVAGVYRLTTLDTIGECILQKKFRSEKEAQTHFIKKSWFLAVTQDEIKDSIQRENEAPTDEQSEDAKELFAEAKERRATTGSWGI